MTCLYSMSAFYDDCKAQDADVILFDFMPAAGATVRDGQYYAVFIDTSKVLTIRDLRGVTMHEDGHLCTGALHKVDSPYQIVAQNEYRANAYSFQKFLPPDELMLAMQMGYTEPWELADYFELPERDIKNALHYWIECKGVKFNNNMDMGA